MTDHLILLSEKSSGSSIFQAELAKHSCINTVDWTSHSEFETLYWVKAACILGYPRESFWASHPPFPPRYCRRSLETILERNLGELPKADTDWKFISTGWEQLIEKFGPVLIEKSPHHLNQWPALECIHRFANATSKKIKFVGLVRNPLSVVYSTYKRWHSAAYRRQFMWAQSYRNLMAMQALVSPEQFMLVRYEDLIASPREQFARVLAYLELDPEPQIGADLHSKSLNKWEQDEQFSFSIHPSVIELGKHFGYSEGEMRCIKDVPASMFRVFDYPRNLAFKIRSVVNFYRRHVF